MLLQGDDKGVEAAWGACHEHLDRYVCPKQIFKVAELPMTPTGKPARSLAEHLAQSLGKAED